MWILFRVTALELGTQFEDVLLKLGRSGDPFAIT